MRSSFNILDFWHITRKLFDVILEAFLFFSFVMKQSHNCPPILKAYFARIRCDQPTHPFRVLFIGLKTPNILVLIKF